MPTLPQPETVTHCRGETQSVSHRVQKSSYSRETPLSPRDELSSLFPTLSRVSRIRCSAKAVTILKTFTKHSTMGAAPDVNHLCIWWCTPRQARALRFVQQHTRPPLNRPPFAENKYNVARHATRLHHPKPTQLSAIPLVMTCTPRQQRRDL